MHPIATKLNQIGAELNAVYFERRQLIEASLLALLAKEHAFVLGPPGTAKTAALKDLMSRFPGATTFEALLSRTRPDAAILGPYNLPELRDKGDFHRKTNGFLPTATLALLDEIGKMSPVLGHDLLAILNERVYHEVNGGRSAHPVPLSTCFTAANEFITSDSDDAAAMWDRLLVRCVVDYIQEPGNFEAMLMQAVRGTGKPAQPTTIEWSDMATVIDDVVPAIPLTIEATKALVALKDKLRAESIRPSDRRFQKSVSVMQASAFLNGRSEATEEDVQVLRYTLWDTAEQIRPVERMSLSVSDPNAEALLDITDLIDEINLGISSRKEEAHQTRAQYGSEVFGKLKLVAAQLKELRTTAEAGGRNTTRIDAANDARLAVQRRIYVELLEMPEAANGVI